jgi:succinoglycan biosynthesis protein ExoA
MKISLVVPTYNEEKHIEKLLECLVKVEPEHKEIFIVDGKSTDNTKNIIDRYVNKYPYIRTFTNEFKYVSFALNLAIPKCTGEIIVRIDAHTVYDDNYFIRIIETFKNTDADIVGGPMRAIGKTPFQKAVAQATSTKFGVGNSNFHDTSFEGYTDTVYLGAWKREIFEKAGLFDTQLIRNQDDEFHYRAKSLGYKIYLNPKIISYYYPREKIAGLFRQYYQYGLYKPLVSLKVKSEIKFRHLVPMFFLCYLLSLPFVIKEFPIYIFPLILYLFIDLIFSLLMSKERLPIKLLMLFTYPVIHISYGSGYLTGSMKALVNLINKGKK